MPTSFIFCGIGLLLSLVSFVYVQQDLRLIIWGKTVVADVMDDYESTSTSRRRSKKVTSLGLTFRFIDEKGDAVLGGAHVPLDYKGEKMAPVGEDAAYNDLPRVLAVKVVYLPGKPEIHRLATASTFWPYLFFFGGLATLAYGVHYFKHESIIEAQQKSSEMIQAGAEESEKLVKAVAVRGAFSFLNFFR